VRSDFAAMRRFSPPAGRPVEAPEALALSDPLPRPATPEARRAGSQSSSFRVRLAVIAMALGLPLFAYAGYSTWQSLQQPSQAAIVAQRASRESQSAEAMREQSEPRRPLRGADAQTRAADRETAQLRKAAPRTPLTDTSALDLSLSITGLGVTNPELVCEALRAGPWLPEDPRLEVCSTALLVELFSESLSGALEPPIPAALALPGTRSQVAVLRVRQTQDGRLRLRGEFRFQDHRSWPMQAAFKTQPSAATAVEGPAGLEFEAALFISPEVCEWAEADGLGLCQIFSRFSPTLIKHLPPGQVWLLKELSWSSDIKLQASLHGYAGVESAIKTVFLEMDDDIHPHWTVTESSAD
jgi:hypothetical protein